MTRQLRSIAQRQPRRPVREMIKSGAETAHLRAMTMQKLLVMMREHSRNSVASALGVAQRMERSDGQ